MTEPREPFLIESMRRSPTGDIRHSREGGGALGTSASAFLAELDAYVAELIETAGDHHCGTCQCASTECHEVDWCKRTWRHRGSHSIIRDEGFDQ